MRICKLFNQEKRWIREWQKNREMLNIDSLAQIKGKQFESESFVTLNQTYATFLLYRVGLVKFSRGDFPACRYESAATVVNQFCEAHVNVPYQELQEKLPTIHPEVYFLEDRFGSVMENCAAHQINRDTVFATLPMIDEIKRYFFMKIQSVFAICNLNNNLPKHLKIDDYHSRYLKEHWGVLKREELLLLLRYLQNLHSWNELCEQANRDGLKPNIKNINFMISISIQEAERFRLTIIRNDFQNSKRLVSDILS